jgi:hypothetical protein
VKQFQQWRKCLKNDWRLSSDGQVTNLRGSVGCRPSLLGPNLPALNLWSNVAKLADEVAVSNESVNLPAAPSSYEKMTRSMTETVQQAGGKLASDLLRLDAKKAEHVGQVKPLEAVIQDVTNDLCSPEGAHNKGMMAKLSSGQGDSSRMRL